MESSTGNCSKCGSSDLKPPRHVRTRGVTGPIAELKIITCNKCRFTEFYELTEEELVPYKKQITKIFIIWMVLPIVIGIAVPIWLIWG